MEANESTREEILAFLTRWAEGYFHKDCDALLAMCIPEANLVLIGTGEDEVHKGPDAFRQGLERVFQEAQSLSMSYSDLSLSNLGKVAWFYAGCQCRAFVEGEAINLEARFSGVLEKREETWLIAQAHFSVPDAQQENGHSFRH